MTYWKKRVQQHRIDRIHVLRASREWLFHGVQLAVSTGLRRGGSLVALRWQVIDFEDE
jgi:hypothetical protein